MSTEENKAKQRRVWEEIINKGNLAVADELFATNYIYHGPVGMEFKGPEGLKQLISMFRNAFPDIHVTVEDMIAEGDKVVCRITGRGTHKGEMMGIPPTGKQTEVTGIIITRWAGGKEVETWEILDMLHMMQQIGVVPPMGQDVR
jgi:steroid delta-isomerase-like uncharacterized protein